MNMKETVKIVVSVLFMSLLALAPLFYAQAREVDNSINEDDSIYRYNALESKVSFSDFENIVGLKKQKKVDNFLLKQEDKFSLFRWLADIF